MQLYPSRNLFLAVKSRPTEACQYQSTRDRQQATTESSHLGWSLNIGRFNPLNLFNRSVISYNDKIGFLQLAIHVVQNCRAGEQK